MYINLKVYKDTQLADYLQVSRNTTWRWSRTGVLPKPFKVGGSTRWDAEEVNKTLASNNGRKA